MLPMDYDNAKKHLLQAILMVVPAIQDMQAADALVKASERAGEAQARTLLLLSWYLADGLEYGNWPSVMEDR